MKTEDSAGTGMPQTATAGSKELLPYIPLVEFLGQLLGEDAEVLLHDVSDFSHSIVAIANSHISGRSVGGPATDLVLRTWQSREYLGHDYLVNYVSDSRDGRRLRSSTFFIRNSDREVIGFLCVNIDDRRLEQARDLIDSMLGANQRAAVPKEEASENLVISMDDLTHTKVRTVIDAAGIDVSRMSREERISCVLRLEEMGVFLIKGSVAQVAEMLGISEPTAYRYLNLVRRRLSSDKRTQGRRA